VIDKIAGKRSKHVSFKMNPELRELHGECLYLLRSFTYSSLIWVPREENALADDLCSAYKEVASSGV
jgi:hypothetical protein